MSVRHGYVHLQTRHDLQISLTDYSWAGTPDWIGGGPWTIADYRPATAYDGNGVFTFAKVPGVNSLWQTMVFKLHYLGDLFVNQHVGIDIEMLEGSFNAFTTAPYNPSNFVVAASWSEPSYALIDHTQVFNPYTGLNIAVPDGSSIFNTYGGTSLEEAVYCPSNAGFMAHYGANLYSVAFWGMFNLSRAEINLSAPRGALEYPFNPDPPLGMTWLNKHDYWFAFSIHYAMMNSDSVKFQIHRIYRQSPYPDPPPPGGGPPFFTQTDIFPTPKGW